MKNEREKNGITELLYETDGMLTEFDAGIVLSSKQEDGDFVVLDRTAFFPEGGGQPADTGFLVTSDGEKIGVRDVQTVDGSVRHFVDRPVPEGTKVRGQVDAAQRYARMQNHGAEHLVSGLVHSLYGYDNVGFHMAEEGLVIDFDGPLTGEQLKTVEMRANEAVFENVPVTVSFPSPEEAERTEYRSKLDVVENIRLITIEGYDICACCAPHLPSTGRFGVIKILGSMPHRGGTRVTMIAGTDAYMDYAHLHEDNEKIMEMLSAKRDLTAEYVCEHLARFQALREENTALKKEMAKLVTKSVLEDLAKRDGNDKSPVTIFTDCLDPVGLRNLVNACTKAFDGIVCAFLGSDGEYRYIFSVCEDRADTADLRGFANGFNDKCNGKGGGSAVMVQGTTTTDRRMIEGYLGSKAEMP